MSSITYGSLTPSVVADPRSAVLKLRRTPHPAWRSIPSPLLIRYAIKTPVPYCSPLLQYVLSNPLSRLTQQALFLSFCSFSPVFLLLYFFPVSVSRLFFSRQATMGRRTASPLPRRQATLPACPPLACPPLGLAPVLLWAALLGRAVAEGASRGAGGTARVERMGKGGRIESGHS